jgi:hypothetical protein
MCVSKERGDIRHYSLIQTAMRMRDLPVYTNHGITCWVVFPPPPRFEVRVNGE